MNKLEIQELRDLPIEGVAKRLGLQVERHKSLCPFHEDHTPSLSYRVSKNTYRCFVCGAKGDTIDLVMKVMNKDFRSAIEWLKGGDSRIIQTTPNIPNNPKKQKPPFDASRYERFFERPWLSPEARRFLFEERRIDPRVASWCRLTSWKNRSGIPWLQIPYFNREGRLVGIQNRNLIKGATPRFRFPQGSQCSIYNLPVLKLLQPGEALYITEGCSDCWAMLSAGHKAIAIPSATLLKPRDVELLSTLNSQLSTPFHMYPDRDAPGERLFMQLQSMLPNLEHHHLPPECKDFSEYYVKRAKPSGFA